MQPIRHLIAIAALGLGLATLAHAQEGPAKPAEAQERLKALVDLIKAKGADAAAKQVMSPDDPLKCRYKDLVCMVADINAGKVTVHTAVPKLVGTPLDDDMLDTDGVSINKQLFGPAKAGKTRWDNKYKFARPDTKKIVPRWAFCEKADEAHVACASVSF